MTLSQTETQPIQNSALSKTHPGGDQRTAGPLPSEELTVIMVSFSAAWMRDAGSSSDCNRKVPGLRFHQQQMETHAKMFQPLDAQTKARPLNARGTTAATLDSMALCSHLEASDHLVPNGGCGAACVQWQQFQLEPADAGT